MAHGMVRRAHAGVAALRARLSNLREKSEKVGMRIAHSAEVAVGAGLAGAVDGYMNEPNVGGAPITFVAGLVLSGGSLFLSEKAGPHFGALGDGIMAASIYRKSREIFEEAAAKAERIDRPALIARRLAGLNDDGTPSDREDLIGHPNQE